MPLSQPRSTYVNMSPDQRPSARGLYVTERRKLFLFDDLLATVGAERFLIGWSNQCQIDIKGDTVKPVHAELELRGGIGYLHDHAREYDMFIDGWQLVRPTRLLVGMVVVVAGVQLVATDGNGNFGIQADTVSDLCRKATELCGSHRAAGKKVGRSHNFVRKQFEPRSQRYKKR